MTLSLHRHYAVPKALRPNAFSQMIVRYQQNKYEFYMVTNLGKGVKKGESEESEEPLPQTRWIIYLLGAMVVHYPRFSTLYKNTTVECQFVS